MITDWWNQSINPKVFRTREEAAEMRAAAQRAAADKAAREAPVVTLHKCPECGTFRSPELECAGCADRKATMTKIHRAGAAWVS